VVGSVDVLGRIFLSASDLVYSLRLQVGDSGCVVGVAAVLLYLFV
jgi:hypothetical protein